MSQTDKFLKDGMYPYIYVEGLDCNSTIIELGTHKGFNAKILANMYKNAIVHTFEPAITFYNEACQSCTDISNLQIYPFGLGQGNYQFSMFLQGEATSMIKEPIINPSIKNTLGFKL
jgi:hypothetical protein